MNDLQKQLEFLITHAEIFNTATFLEILSVKVDSNDERASGFQEPPLVGELLEALKISSQGSSVLLKFVSYFDWVVADGKVQLNDTETVDLLVAILNIREFNDEIMIFTAEGWQLCDQKFLIKVINAVSKVLLNLRASAHSRSESILKALLLSHDVHSVDFNEDYVQVKNGIFNIETGQMKPHDADIIPRIRLEVDLADLLSLESDVPEHFKKFIESITEEDNVYYEYLLDILAYVIAPFKVNSLKSVIFYGSGGNGKTILIDVIRSLYNPSSVTSTNIDDLNSDFGLSGLQKASLNISQEISASQPKSKAVQQLKAILEENTAHLRVNQKYRTAKDYEINVKMLFGSNSVIDFGTDNRKPLSRRMVVLPFNFTPTTPDLDLKEKLENEKAEILAFLLKRIHEIYQRNALSPQPEVVTEEMDTWFHTQNLFVTKKPETEKAVRDWLRDNITVTQGAKDILQSDLNQKIRTEVSSEATAQICNAVITSFYNTEIAKNNGYRYWKNLEFTQQRQNDIDLDSEEWTFEEDDEF